MHTLSAECLIKAGRELLTLWFRVRFLSDDSRLGKCCCCWCSCCFHFCTTELLTFFFSVHFTVIRGLLLKIGPLTIPDYNSPERIFSFYMQRFVLQSLDNSLKFTRSYTVSRFFTRNRQWRVVTSQRMRNEWMRIFSPDGKNESEIALEFYV